VSIPPFLGQPITGTISRIFVASIPIADGHVRRRIGEDFVGLGVPRMESLQPGQLLAG
jgi:hypothetical protein